MIQKHGRAGKYLYYRTRTPADGLFLVKVLDSDALYMDMLATVMNNFNVQL